LNVELDADGVPREIRKELRRERRSLRQERREYRETLDYAVSEARQRGFSVSY
jgi:hypothetical protein